MEKIILTDCDGVLLQWEDGFEQFVLSKGHSRVPDTQAEYSMAVRYNITVKKAQAYIKEYNESDAMSNLAPFADAVEYVSELASLGFRFIAVTSLSDHPDAKTYRTHDVVCLEMGASKAHVLMRWADSGYFWIEDHMRQAEAGHEAGLRTVLINHPYNSHYKTDLFPIVSNETPWEEIYHLVCDTYHESL
jgi:FMN phosphatase YigB (HAD superfamily)